MSSVFTWIKNLGLSLKNYVEIAAFIFVSALLVLLRLKDKQIHSLQVQLLKQKFAEQDKAAAENIETLRKDYDDAKKNIDN